MKSKQSTMSMEVQTRAQDRTKPSCSPLPSWARENTATRQRSLTESQRARLNLRSRSSSPSLMNTESECIPGQPSPYLEPLRKSERAGAAVRPGRIPPPELLSRTRALEAERSGEHAAAVRQVARSNSDATSKPVRRELAYLIVDLQEEALPKPERRATLGAGKGKGGGGGGGLGGAVGGGGGEGELTSVSTYRGLCICGLYTCPLLIACLKGALRQ